MSGTGDRPLGSQRPTKYQSKTAKPFHCVYLDILCYQEHLCICLFSVFRVVSRAVELVVGGRPFRIFNLTLEISPVRSDCSFLFKFTHLTAFVLPGVDVISSYGNTWYPTPVRVIRKVRLEMLPRVLIGSKDATADQVDLRIWRYGDCHACMGDLA